MMAGLPSVGHPLRLTIGFSVHDPHVGPRRGDENPLRSLRTTCVPSTMNLPKLDQSIHKIKAIRSGLNQHASPKTVAEVYLGGIGLLYHLKADQATLRRIRCVRLNRKSLE